MKYVVFFLWRLLIVVGNYVISPIVFAGVVLVDFWNWEFELIPSYLRWISGRTSYSHTRRSVDGYYYGKRFVCKTAIDYLFNRATSE